MPADEGENPPPPPPPESANELDLPDPDNPYPEARLTEEERALPRHHLRLLPLGYVPPPDIRMVDGMPRETFRHPDEFAPTAYFIQTKNGFIRLNGTCNSMGQDVAIPALGPETALYCQEFDAEGNPGLNDGEPVMREVGVFDATVPHQLLVITKSDPSAKRWTRLTLRSVELPDGPLKNSELLAINGALDPVRIQLAGTDAAQDVAPGRVMRLPLPEVEILDFSVFGMNAQGAPSSLIQNSLFATPERLPVLVFYQTEVTSGTQVRTRGDFLDIQLRELDYSPLATEEDRRRSARVGAEVPATAENPSSGS